MTQDETVPRWVLKAALVRVDGRFGVGATTRKLYTLAVLDWGSTYGFGDPNYSPPGSWLRPGGIYMIEGSPCRGVLIIRRGCGDWLVDYVGNERLRFHISDQGKRLEDHRWPR